MQLLSIPPVFFPLLSSDHFCPQLCVPPYLQTEIMIQRNCCGISMRSHAFLYIIIIISIVIIIFKLNKGDLFLAITVVLHVPPSSNVPSVGPVFWNNETRFCQTFNAVCVGKSRETWTKSLLVLILGRSSDQRRLPVLPPSL